MTTAEFEARCLARRLAIEGGTMTREQANAEALRDREQLLEVNRWAPFSDAEIGTIYAEMCRDDGLVYGFEEGDEPGRTIYLELRAELERRGMDENETLARY